MARRSLLLLCLALLLLLLLPPCWGAGRRDVTAAVDRMLDKPSAVEAALRCFLADTDAPCTRKAAIVKRLIGTKVRSNCARCSVNYRKGVARLLAYLSLYRPKEMRRLLTKYDPNGNFLRKYRARWMAEGIFI